MKRFSFLAMLFAFVFVGLVAADSASAAGRLLRRGCCEPACDAGPSCAASCCDNGPSCCAAEPSCGCERTRCSRAKRCCRRPCRRSCSHGCASGCTSGCNGGGCTGGCTGGGCSGADVISEGVPTQAPAAPAAPAKT